MSSRLDGEPQVVLAGRPVRHFLAALYDPQGSVGRGAAYAEGRLSDGNAVWLWPWLESWAFERWRLASSTPPLLLHTTGAPAPVLPLFPLATVRSHNAERTGSRAGW